MGNWFWNGVEFERATHDVLAPTMITFDNEVYVLLEVEGNSERPAYMPLHVWDEQRNIVHISVDRGSMR